MTPRFFTLWGVNAALEPGEAHRQLDAFVEAGLDGVVFHPRRYPTEPAYLGDDYLAVLSDTIEYAASIGLAFWIYDENGWPSGTVGGRLLDEHPGDAQQWLTITGPPSEAGWRIEGAEGPRWATIRRGAGIDYLSPVASAHFVELTYERYRSGLSAAAFSHVEAFFDDEPEFGLGHAYAALPADGAIPWTERLPDLFEERYGRPLIPLLPALFTADAASGLARVQFWELVTDLFADGFLGTLDAWCRAHGKTFTAHMKGEESPLFQVPMVGSLQQVLRRVGLPGVDALGRPPTNDFFPRQASSTARQFGDGRCMVEVFGGAGWGAAPADLERALLALGRNGMTDFVLHLSQYRLDSEALADWPPSQPLHLTWREAYPALLDRVRAELTRAPRPQADTLVVVPQRAVTELFEPSELLETNIHDGSTYPASAAAAVNDDFLALVASVEAAGVAFDLADERTVETHGALNDTALRIGGASYEHVILSPSARLEPATRRRLQPVFVGPPIAAHAPAVEVPSRERVHVSMTPVWQTPGLPRNAFPLEPERRPDGSFVAVVESDAELASEPLELVFADEPSSLEVDGRPVGLDALVELTAGRGHSIALPGLAPTTTVTFVRRKDGPVTPRVWLQGGFVVRSQTAYADAGGQGQLTTAGPFRLTAGPLDLSDDLVRAGLPFAGEPLRVTAEIEVVRVATSVRLDGLTADAVHLDWNGVALGWAWGDAVTFEHEILPGRHRLTLDVAPNGFNRFGPHHYYLGDHHIVSPAQIAGDRNFADPGGAPEHTHVPTWSFRRWRLPSRLVTTERR